MRVAGEVTWFNEQTGFGFILGDDKRDIFVHYTEVTRDGFQTLVPGERVTYEVGDADRGPKALDVRLENEEAPKGFL